MAWRWSGGVQQLCPPGLCGAAACTDNLQIWHPPLAVQSPAPRPPATCPPACQPTDLPQGRLCQLVCVPGGVAVPGHQLLWRQVCGVPGPRLSLCVHRVSACCAACGEGKHKGWMVTAAAAVCRDGCDRRILALDPAWLAGRQGALASARRLLPPAPTHY